MKYRKFISLAVIIAVLIIMIYYLNQNMHLLLSLHDISLGAILALIGLSIIGLIINGVFFRDILRKLNVYLSPQEWIGFSFISIFINIITPFAGGFAVFGAYLKLHHEFEVSKYISTLASQYFIRIWTACLVGIFILAIEPKKIFEYWQLFIVLLIFWFIITLLAFIPNFQFTGDHRIVNWINQSLDAFYLLKRDYSLLGRLSLYTFISIILRGISYWLAYISLGFSVSLIASIMLGITWLFSFMIPILPAGFGIQEAIASLTSGLFGFGSGEGFVVSLLIRAASTITVFILGPSFMYLLMYLPQKKLKTTGGAEPRK